MRCTLPTDRGVCSLCPELRWKQLRKYVRERLRYESGRGGADKSVRQRWKRLSLDVPQQTGDFIGNGSPPGGQFVGPDRTGFSTQHIGRISRVNLGHVCDVKTGHLHGYPTDDGRSHAVQAHLCAARATVAVGVTDADHSHGVRTPDSAPHAADALQERVQRLP